MPTEETSLIWGGKTLGDASDAPYSEQLFMLYLTRMARYSAGRKYGILSSTHASYSGNLAPTNPAGATVRIASGAALNNGFLYLNDANVDFNCSVNGHYHVVLRAIVSQKTVRLVALGPDPAQYPTLVHTADINDISIALVGSSGGVVTAVYDRRRFFRNLSLSAISCYRFFWHRPWTENSTTFGALIQCGSIPPEEALPYPPGSSYRFPRSYSFNVSPIIIFQAAGGATSPSGTKLISRAGVSPYVDYYLDHNENLSSIWWISFGHLR